MDKCMSNANKEQCGQCSTPSGISLNKGKRTVLGSCLACSDDSYKIVYEIGIGPMKVRVCAKCLHELGQKINRFLF